MTVAMVALQTGIDLLCMLPPLALSYVYIAVSCVACRSEPSYDTVRTLCYAY